MNKKSETKININLTEIDDNITFVQNKNQNDDIEGGERILTKLSCLFFLSLGPIIFFIMN